MNNIINDIKNNYYYSIILIAFVFFAISKYNVSILLSMMIAIYLYVIIDNNIKSNIVNNQNNEDKKQEILSNEVKEVEQINTNNFYTQVNNNKNIKFLGKDKVFIDIIYNIRFIKKFNKTTYNKFIININKLMKIYIYILSNRYELNTFLPIFDDTRNNILELFYSLIFIIPNKFKHIYGFDPYEEIERSLDDFRKKTEKMLNILINFGKINKGYDYINFNKYIPYEKNKELYLP
jgi:hypothetical protein